MGDVRGVWAYIAEGDGWREMAVDAQRSAVYMARGQYGIRFCNS